MKTVALLSGGLDSAVAALIAQEKGDEIYALNIYYGQKHTKEIYSARDLAKYFDWPFLHFEISIPCYSALTDLNGDVNKELPSGLPASFVPGRNMIMLSYAASYAYSKEARKITGGWNFIDYPGYPDCRPDFLLSMERSMNKALGLSIEEFTNISLVFPLGNRTKRDIIKIGEKLNLPFELTWSCYEGGETPCGVCSSCKFRAQGFYEADINDPLVKEV